jgi:hypothetical protein
MDYFSPNPLQAFSDPRDKKNYNDKPISNDVITEVFQEFVSGTRERESEDYLRTSSGEPRSHKSSTVNLLADQASVFPSTIVVLRQPRHEAVTELSLRVSKLGGATHLVLTYWDAAEAREPQKECEALFLASCAEGTTGVD